MKKLILPVLGLGAILTGLVVIPLVAAGIKRGAKDIMILTPHAPDVVTVNREMWDFDAPDPAKTENYDHKLLQVYGIPHGKEKLVFVDESKLVYPAGKEKRPDLFFLPVDKQKGENPWQLKTVDFGAKLVRGGAVEVGMVFLVLFLLFQLAAPAPPGRSPAADTH